MTSNPELSYGERGAWVTYLQTLLNHHYQQTVVAETGEFDEATAGVVEYFRQQNGMPRGSTADSAVWSTLEAAEPADANEAWIVAVQWHPEDLTERALFDGFARAVA